MPDSVTLSYRNWFSYGVGHVLNDLCASMWFTYLLIFFVYALKFDNALAGTALFIGQVADGLSTSIVGIVLEKQILHWCHKYGRRKSWHLVGTLCVLISFPFIFSPCPYCKHFSDFQKLAYYSVFIILFQFGWAATQISHLSLVPDLTTDQHERTSLITLRYSFTVLSNIAVYIIVWFVLNFHRGNNTGICPDDKYEFQIVAYIVIIFGVITSVIFHIGVREINQLLNDDNNQLVESNYSRISLFRSSKIYNVAAIYVATRLFVNLSQIYIPLYLHSYLELPAKLLAILPLVIFISSFLSSFATKPLNVKLGRKLTYIFGAIIGVGACMCIRFGSGPLYIKYGIYGVAVLFGCASSIILVTSLGITADLIGNNNNNGAFIYGIMSFGDKISSGVAVILIEHLKHYVDCSSYYREIIVYSCGGAVIFGLLAVTVIKPVINDVAIIDSTKNDVSNNMLENETFSAESESVHE